MNHKTPVLSNVAVFRLAYTLSGGKEKILISFIEGFTRTIAFSPPSVIHGAPSGPTITPWGADPLPR